MHVHVEQLPGLTICDESLEGEELELENVKVSDLLT
jgi:hypothetical protein